MPDGLSSRSQPPWPTSPTPTRANFSTLTPRTCWPTWPPSPTRELPVTAATCWSPSWDWPPPRCWQAPGRSLRSPNGPADVPQPVRAALDARRATPDQFAVPTEATIGRTLARLDADALAGAIGAWPADRDQDRSEPAASRRRAVAVDGKTLRGARARAPDGDGRPVHLLAAMDHTSRAVLAQHQVGGAPNEVPGVRPAAGRARPCRDGRHRPRAADPPGGRRVPGVRDVTFAEDASQVRTGAAPSVVAALRNLAIGGPQLGGAGQRRRRATPPPPRPTPTYGHARDQPWMCATSRRNYEAPGRIPGT
jgi:hypothetical protein